LRPGASAEQVGTNDTEGKHTKKPGQPTRIGGNHRPDDTTEYAEKGDPPREAVSSRPRACDTHVRKVTVLTDHYE
jgi:hypothetical protein